jgi:hypothetical protein
MDFDPSRANQHLKERGLRQPEAPEAASREQRS